MNEYNWGVLGCGVIANQLAEAMDKEGRKLYGVSNRTYEKAVSFAEKYEVSKVYEDYHEMVYDRDAGLGGITGETGAQRGG